MPPKFFSNTSIPKTSEEAFDILASNQDLETIEHILFNFKQLVDMKKSMLTSHARTDLRIPNNQEFTENMEQRFQRLKSAVEENKPYPYLFGDVCSLKEDLQVILGYYQSQMDKNQPISSSYLKSVQRKNSALRAILSDSQSLLNEEESNILTKQNINFCADDIMLKDSEKISNLVITPYLADHSKEPGFSYF